MPRTFATTNTYLSKPTAIITAPPFSFAAWVNVTTLANSPLIMMINQGTLTAEFFALLLDTTGHLQAWAQHGGNHGASVTSTTMAINTWHHVCGVWTSATSRNAYLDGGGTVQDTTSFAPTAGLLTATTIGGDQTAFGDQLNGALAYAAFWKTALTPGDAASLATGGSPRLVQPSQRISYCRIDGILSPEPDLDSATRWTLTGTAAQSTTAPRIYEP